MIFSNIDENLKNTKLLEFDTPEMISFFIEDFLKSASPLSVSRDNETREYNLSLKRQTIDELLDLCRGLYRYEIKMRSRNGFSFGGIWYLLYINKDLALYQVGPIQYNIDIKLPDCDSNDSFSQGSIATSFSLVGSVQNSDPKVSIVKHDTILIDRVSYYDQLRREARFYNRALSIGSNSDSIFTYLFDKEMNARSFMYDTLRK